MSFDWSASDSVFQPTQGPLEKLGVERLGPYVLEGQVGAGGMGVVYRARDTNLDRPVAIKLLIAGRSAGLAQRKRMQREAQTLARLRHPGLLGVHASGEVEGCPYLVTEWLEGEPLDERLKREGGLPIDEAIEITLAVGRAVAHAHERGILHRDIKPSNVVQAGGRGPVLIDFGLATAHLDPGQSRLTKSGAFAGTPGYAPPEQITNAAKVDERADVYSLGATLYALLSGAGPFSEASNMAELLARAAAGSQPPVRQRRPEVPPAVEAVLQRALAPDPGERYMSVDALVSALEEARHAPAAGSKRWVALLGGAALLALSFAGGALARRTSAAPPASPGAPGPTLAPSLSPPPTATPSAPPTPAEPLDEPEARAALAGSRQRLRELSDAASLRGFLDLADARRKAAELEAAYELALRASEVLLRSAPPRERGTRTLAHARLLADAGRWEEALAALEPCLRDPALTARAWLTAGEIRAARSSVDHNDEVAGRSAFSRAARVTGEALAEQRAARLGELWGLASGGKIDRDAAKRALGLARESLQAGGWERRSAWLALNGVYQPARAGVRDWLGIRFSQLELRAPLPYASHAFGDPWTTTFVEGRVTAAQLRRMELLVHHRPTLATLSAALEQAGRIGWIDSVERLAAVELGGVGISATRQREQARAVAAGQTGIAGELRGPGALALTITPVQERLHLVVHVPADAREWELVLRGSQQDLDLFVRHDGPPARTRYAKEPPGPPTLYGQTMARAERVASIPGRVTTGAHQVLFERGVQWPEPLAATLELRVARGGETLPRWRGPWEVLPESQSTTAKRNTLAQARRRALAGELEPALELLATLERDSPELVLVRASMLAQAGAWARIPPLPRVGRPDIVRTLDYMAAEALQQLGEPAQAAARLEPLARDHPELLAAREELGLLQLILGRARAARATLAGILARDPAQQPAQLLLALSRALAEGADPLELLRQDERLNHVRARRLALQALLHLQPAAVPRLLAQLPPPAKQLPERFCELEALIALQRGADARALADQLADQVASPASKSRLTALRARLPR